MIVVIGLVLAIAGAFGFTISMSDRHSAGLTFLSALVFCAGLGLLWYWSTT